MMKLNDQFISNNLSATNFNCKVFDELSPDGKVALAPKELVEKVLLSDDALIKQHKHVIIR